MSIDPLLSPFTTFVPETDVRSLGESENICDDRADHVQLTRDSQTNNAVHANSFVFISAALSVTISGYIKRATSCQKTFTWRMVLRADCNKSQKSGWIWLFYWHFTHLRIISTNGMWNSHDHVWLSLLFFIIALQKGHQSQAKHEIQKLGSMSSCQVAVQIWELVQWKYTHGVSPGLNQTCLNEQY